MSTEEKIREQNRIRQLAFKVRGKMPKDYKSFCQVAVHLVHNAHRYEWEIEPEKDVHAEVEAIVADLLKKEEIKSK